jgi:hypothetical protein
MQTTIRGIRYNTEKALLIGEADNIGAGADSTSDYAYWGAGLYQTPRSKRYFLAGEGGPLSRLHGGRILPITKGEALAFAKRFLPFTHRKTAGLF